MAKQKGWREALGDAIEGLLDGVREAIDGLLAPPPEPVPVPVAVDDHPGRGRRGGGRRRSR